MKSFFWFIFLSLFICHECKSQQIVEDIGHGIQIGLPLSALGLTILEKDKKGAIQLLTSFTVQTATVLSVKRIVNRKRPNGKNYSFPSGHTAVSFMSSTFIWKRYGWEYGIPATVLAGFVGYSRAGTDNPVHYYSDVFVGAALGILTSWIFTKKKENVSIELQGDTSHVSLGLTWKLQ